MRRVVDCATHHHAGGGFSRLLLALILVLFAFGRGVAAQQRPAWWDGQWRARMLLSIAPDEPYLGAPGAYAWVHLPADVEAGGADLRVVDPGGRPVPFGIVHASAEGRCLIAFAARRKQGSYAVYYDNPYARPVPQAFPAQGLFYETRPIPENAVVNDWSDALRVLASAGPAYGAAPWGQVFDAYNPFGPQSRYVGIYSGFIRCPTDGTYNFATLSDDSSFLLVDDRLVTQWVGPHRIQQGRHGEQGGTIELTRGPHRFEYVHFSFGTSSRAAAAWQPPGGDHVVIIPGGAFPGLPEARVFESQRLGQPACADFTHRTESYCEADEAQMTAVRFVSTSSTEGDTLIERYAWDFGDGQGSAEPQPLHVFLAPGTFDVTLSITTTAGQGTACRKRVRVEPVYEDMDFTLAKMAKFWDGVKDYRFDRLPTPSLTALWTFATHMEMPDAAATAAEQLYGRRDDLEPAQFADVALALGRYYEGRGGRPDEARRCFEAALDALPESDQRRRLEARFALADHIFYYENDPARARQEYAKLRADFPRTDPSQARLALIRIGDTHRQQGDAAKALEFYSQAEADPAYAPQEPADVAKGAGLQQVRAYLRRGEGAEARKRLEALLWLYPTMRLEGEPALLHVQAALLDADFAEAKKQADAYIAFSKDANYLPALHVGAAEACIELGRTDEAAAHYRKVLDDFPEAPQVEDAANGLHRLGR
jgi:tetratricopeptide (TPR) repeat protein